MWDLDEFIIWGLGVIAAGICIVVIGAVIFLGVDSVGIEGSSSSAVVLDTSYAPESTVTSFLTVGNIQVPQIQTYPASWSAAVRTKGGLAISCAISQAQYSVLAKGSVVEVGVGSGRMSGSSYCTRLATQ
jgi:hypothetical protein